MKTFRKKCLKGYLREKSTKKVEKYYFIATAGRPPTSYARLCVRWSHTAGLLLLLSLCNSDKLDVNQLCDPLRWQSPSTRVPRKFHSAEFLIWTFIINNKVPFPKDNQVLHVKSFQILEWLIHTLGAQDSWFSPPPNIIQETSGQGVSLGHIGKTQDWIMGLHLQSTSVFSLVNPDSYYTVSILSWTPTVQYGDHESHVAT